MLHTRESVIARTRREFEALDSLVSSLGPSDWSQPVPRPESRDPWTVKDSLAHVVYWKEHTARGLRRESKPAEIRGLEVNGINAVIYERWRDRSSADVVAYHRRVHDEVMRTLAELPEERFSGRERGAWWPGDLDGHSRAHRIRDIEMALAVDHGLLVLVDGRPTVRFHRRLSHSRRKVWPAISEPDGLEHWFPAQMEFEPRVGATIRFVFEGEKAPPTTGKVTELEALKRFAFTGEKEELRIDLRPDGRGSVVTFTHLLSDRATASRDATGWHVCLGALANYLDGRPLKAPPKAEVDRLRAEYVKRFGIPAAPPPTS